MEVIDTRGHLCPMPIIMVGKFIKKMGALVPMKILVDNEISRDNLLRYLKDNGYLTACKPVESYWAIVAAQEHDSDTLEIEHVEEKYVSQKSKANQVIVVKSDKMGIGNDDLGGILMRGFINALVELDEYPQKLAFYNSGALLCIDSSPALNSLNILSEHGVDIMICGACVDFYQIKDQVKVGRITNMYEICETLSKCEKVIYP